MLWTVSKNIPYSSYDEKAKYEEEQKILLMKYFKRKKITRDLSVFLCNGFLLLLLTFILLKFALTLFGVDFCLTCTSNFQPKHNKIYDSQIISLHYNTITEEATERSSRLCEHENLSTSPENQIAVAMNIKEKSKIVKDEKIFPEKLEDTQHDNISQAQIPKKNSANLDLYILKHNVPLKKNKILFKFRNNLQASSESMKNFSDKQDVSNSHKVLAPEHLVHFPAILIRLNKKEKESNSQAHSNDPSNFENFTNEPNYAVSDLDTKLARIFFPIFSKIRKLSILQERNGSEKLPSLIFIMKQLTVFKKSVNSISPSIDVNEKFKEDLLNPRNANMDFKANLEDDINESMTHSQKSIDILKDLFNEPNLLPSETEAELSIPKQLEQESSPLNNVNVRFKGVFLNPRNENMEFKTNLEENSDESMTHSQKSIDIFKEMFKKSSSLDSEIGKKNKMITYATEISTPKEMERKIGEKEIRSQNFSKYSG